VEKRSMNSFAWLALLVWVGIPLLVILMTPVLWRRSRIPLQKGLVVTASIAVLSSPMLISNGIKWWYDRQVSELCAKDGGVKVYETVRLTPELLDKAGRIWIPDKAQAKSTDEYYYVTDRHYYRKGNPEVSRTQHQVIRRSDGKVLGELIRYGRSRGELPGLWHGSSFMCPDPTKASNFESSIFVNGDIQ
jgi:hypothetical protein